MSSALDRGVVTCTRSVKKCAVAFAGELGYIKSASEFSHNIAWWTWKGKVAEIGAIVAWEFKLGVAREVANSQIEAAQKILRRTWELVRPFSGYVFYVEGKCQVGIAREVCDVETFQEILGRAWELVFPVCGCVGDVEGEFYIGIARKILRRDIETFQELPWRAWELVGPAFNCEVGVAREVLRRDIEMFQELLRRTWDFVGPVSRCVCDVELYVGIARKVIRTDIETL